MEITERMDGLSRELGAILTLCTNRLDYDNLSTAEIESAPLVAGRIAALAGPVAQIEVKMPLKLKRHYLILKKNKKMLVGDAVVEPVLWRSAVPLDLMDHIAQCLKSISAELYWLDVATKGLCVCFKQGVLFCYFFFVLKGFIQSIEETRQNGVLDNSALPLMFGLKSELSDALNEIGVLMHFARHPKQKLDLAWRPAGIIRAQQIMAKNALRLSMVESLFVTGHRSEMTATRQVVAFSNTLFCLDKLASSVCDLWETVFRVAASQRRSSIFKKK